MVWSGCFFLAVLVLADLTFDQTEFFVARQTRFFPTSDSTIFLYSLPVPVPTSNLSAAAVVLSGYDLRPALALNFMANLSINYQSSTFQILMQTGNSTKFYSLNFFLLTVAEEASSWLHVQTYCFQTLVNPYNPQLLKYTQQHFMEGPFSNVDQDQVRVIPYISSIHSEVYISGHYLNLSSTGTKNGSAQIYLNVYRNYSFFISACATLLVIKEQFVTSQPLLAYSYSGRLQMVGGVKGKTLEDAAGSNFGIKYGFGPTFQPKCFVGFHAAFIESSSRGNINFDMSGVGVTTVTSSTGYILDYSYFCLAKIVCPQSGYQYYSLIGDCQPACSISHCQTCSSSTSCQLCSPSYFIDALSRCSPCMANCVSCPNVLTCTECALGYYYGSGVCQLCAVYCLKCSLSQCFTCQYGYTPNGVKCVSCQVIMPYCLDCPNAAQCTTCTQTYVFSSNYRACKLCSELMTDCVTCNLPNNCLKCRPGYFLYTFSSCKICRFDVDVCCGNYVANCSSCASSSQCKMCQAGFRVTNGSCQNCQSVFGSVCTGCDQNGCYECVSGYFAAASGCLLCNSTIPRCLKCNNMTNCQVCESTLMFAGGRCLDCPVWPLNSLYFIDNSSVCRSCDRLDPYCITCSPSGLCLSCSGLHYLNLGGCLLCSSAIPLCLSCKTGTQCAKCQKGHFLDLQNSSRCLSCSSYIDRCLQCWMDWDLLLNQPKYICSKCEPLYYPSLTTGQCALCSSVLQNCVKCVNAVSCIACIDNYYLNADYLCVACGNILPGCSTCLSLSVCKVCQDGYVLQGSYCSECNLVVHYCELCDVMGDGTVGCNRCQQGYYLSSFAQCGSCKEKDALCAACTAGKCTRCVSTFYATLTGQCKQCNQLIPNCLYCTPELVCLSCMAGTVFFPLQHSCQTCNQSISGCSQCNYTIDATTQTPKVSCSSCQQGYLPFTSASSLSCIFCSEVIMYCESCSSLTLCARCQNISFVNPEGKCSRCELYLPNCRLCSTADVCLQCMGGYTLDVRGECARCDLAVFGRGAGQVLCTMCDALTQPNQVLCSQCISQAYLTPTKGQCILCKDSLPNCKTCHDPYLCIQCLQSYYFSTNTRKCLPCQFQLCQTCTQNACLSCQGTALMIGGQCTTCESRFAGCFECVTEGCLGCQDGFYLSGGVCVECSAIGSDCVLCDAGMCRLRDPGKSVPTGTYKAVGITALIGFVLVLAVLIILCYRFRRVAVGVGGGVAGEGRGETSRRMSEDQIYQGEFELKSSQICHYCKKSKPRFMKIELLCNECQNRVVRGDQHKIVKDLRKDFVDRVKEDESSVAEGRRVELNEEVSGGSEGRDNFEGELAIYSRAHKKKEEQPLPSTKGTSSKSKQIRDMF